MLIFDRLFSDSALVPFIFIGAAFRNDSTAVNRYIREAVLDWIGKVPKAVVDTRMAYEKLALWLIRGSSDSN